MINTSLVKEKENLVLDFLFFWNCPITAGCLKSELNFKHSTLNSILKRLEKQELLTWEKYKEIKLTEKGRESAMHVSNHHFIIERFLKDSLNCSEELAHNEALHLAGAFSCELIEEICKKLKISHNDSHGNFCDIRKYFTD
ncbi:metal-dependent transcriptional regulator [Promethearchaeum syntrophicum]|uniref:Metal-dependent transcriptional regulator n=1 Tax=Promethearchaeum syntrophicum TaxID=2594042 RepID=A0A5B9D7P9_9ARCH|nr:iron dependent repressor, metal binding and dimerization domain protein [Candidatus Prometheoarchaeum syntrophicum]QEE15053.1 manganese transport regulator MntR [Candidatus Prometheoarchaeum syntrophicum]